MNQKNEMKAFFVFSATVVGQLSGTSYARTFNVLIAKENTNEWQMPKIHTAMVMLVSGFLMRSHIILNRRMSDRKISYKADPMDCKAHHYFMPDAHR